MADPIKKQLQEIKEAACSAYEICKDRDEPLGLTSNTSIVLLSIDVMEAKLTALLDPAQEPSFNPPDAGSDYAPIDLSNATLGMYANNAKQEACAALAAYCDGDPQGAGRSARRLNDILDGYRTAVGAK